MHNYFSSLIKETGSVVVEVIVVEVEVLFTVVISGDSVRKGQ